MFANLSSPRETTQAPQQPPVSEAQLLGQPQASPPPQATTSGRPFLPLDPLISAVTPGRLPLFWKEDPNLWFAQAEAIFCTHRITSPITKFHSVVAAIEYSVLQHASDIITAPVNSSSYESLRNRLITMFGESEDKKLKRLLTEMDLGDMRPSQLLQKMKQLAQHKISDNALRTLWVQRLPPRMREILTVSHGSDISTLAEIADRLAEEVTPQIAAVQTESELIKKINELSNQVAELKLQSRRRFTSTSRQRNLSRNRNRSASRERGPRNSICYYHRLFSDNARNCRKPCAFNAPPGNA